MSRGLSSDDAATLAAMRAMFPPDDDLSAREKREIAQPTRAATPQNIFRWHDDKYTVFEDETDPKEIKDGVRFRRVGVTAGGRLTDAQISAQETRLGHVIPMPWRDVFHHYNGGYASGLYWGDRHNPKQNDLVPAPTTRPAFLPLEDVMPLAHFVSLERPELDAERLSPKLIALAWRNDEAIVLDYRVGPEPRVGKIYISGYAADPVSLFETQDATWWPNMKVFFAGLYLQDRSY